MKVHILLENLQKHMGIATHAISTRNQLPILSHVLLEAKGDRLFISSTDLEIGIQTSISAQVDEEGATTVPAKLFSELINSLPQDKLTLQTTETQLEVLGKKSRSVLATSPKEEFPTLFEEKGAKLLTFEKGTIKTIFNKIVFSAGIESTRPALSGVLLKKAPGGILVVATDGYRMSLDVIAQKELPEGVLEKPILIPARVIREAGVLRDDVSLYVAEKNNQVLFEDGQTQLVGRLIDAVFPNFEKVIPTDVATKIFFDREELLRAVKTCSIFARETANVVTLTLRKENSSVSAKTPSLGENVVVFETQLTGEENEIAFNAKYIVDALSNISEERLSFEMTGPLNPGVFRGTGDFFHLIMPIRSS